MCSPALPLLRQSTKVKPCCTNKNTFQHKNILYVPPPFRMRWEREVKQRWLVVWIVSARTSILDLPPSEYLFCSASLLHVSLLLNKLRSRGKNLTGKDHSSSFTGIILFGSYNSFSTEQDNYRTSLVTSSWRLWSEWWDRAFSLSQTKLNQDGEKLQRNRQQFVSEWGNYFRSVLN